MVKRVLPEMRRLFPGEVEVVIVQHRGDASGGKNQLESGRLHAGGLDRVGQWTQEGKYAGADVIEHAINYPAYPSIPGLHLCVKAALDRKADFHLWLEDDALVMDYDCGRWDQLLGRREVGAYRDFHNLNSAYLLTRPDFDARMLTQFEDYERWNWKRRLEPELRRNLRTRRTYLNPAYAVRYHHRNYPYTGIRYVVDRVRDLWPEDLPLLDIDFGEGTSSLPPVTPEEMRVHAAATPFLGRVGRWKQRFVEKFLLKDGIR